MTGTGMTKNRDGYLRIKKRGIYRDQLAHRVYIARQVGRPLRRDEEVHHDCMTRDCWPPTDFHLCLVDAVLAPYMYQMRGRKRFNRRRTNEDQTRFEC